MFFNMYAYILGIISMILYYLIIYYYYYYYFACGCKFCLLLCLLLIDFVAKVS